MNFKRILKKKSSSMSDVEIKKSKEDFIYKSLISTSSDAEVKTYDNIQDLIVVSVTTQGLLTLYFVDVSSFVVKGKKYELFAVYDGHGGRDSRTGIKKGGHEVAKECVSYLPKVIKESLKNNNSTVLEAFAGSFEKADKEHFLLDRDRFPENVGSTAIVILRSDKNLYVANLGDSRAVICKDGKVFFETVDHDWTSLEEQKRIGINKDNQTYIINTDSGKKKFILNGKYLNGEKWNLATSRSFGDYHFKLGSDKPPITAKPKVDKFIIDKDMKLILVASDGIWENDRGLRSDHFLSKFIQIAKKQTSPDVDECLKETCKELVRWCMIDHLKLDFKNYGDNIALIAIGLLNGQTKQEWFRDIKEWKGVYEDSNLILRDIDDTVQEDDNEDMDYGSDSESCKIDFTQL
ncbi:phosphatase 2C-like domain-containing protein [Glomus cerebriforme]|uniref:Phosphatase 2C-like domain-containing protein n=1 Tax=Glomus cerebriforme TaxID=658196 RepID=A0A397SIH0_9GLOM|nr:phosphatase 2C-like domain-containing protein [Glomus cerebriforme]